MYRNGDRKHTTQSAGWLIDRSSQALSTLQRFPLAPRRCPVDACHPARNGGLGLGGDVVVGAPAGRDGPSHRRGRSRGIPVELQSDGRLIHLQTEELRSGVTESLTLVLHDYANDQGIAHLRLLSADALMDLLKVVAALQPAVAADGQLSQRIGPARVPPVAPTAPAALRHAHRPAWWSVFGSLPDILSASAAELESVEGIGAATARHVRDGLARLVEASIFERYE